MYKKNYEPSDQTYISAVMARKECKKHSAIAGTPCWWVVPGLRRTTTFLAGVCNDRVTKAGYVGKISPQSLSRTPSRPKN